MYDDDRSRVMTAVPASFASDFPSALGVAMAPVRAGVAVSVYNAGVPFFMPEFTALEFPVILPFSPVPVVLVEFGPPVTVGLVPIGSHGLAGTGEQD